jgi:uncharacterized protein (DUF1800 family)
MGEPLFLAFTPTGFPGVGTSWVSADALLIRMDFVLDLTSDRIPGTKIRLTDPSKSTQTIMRLVAPEGLTPSTRAALGEANDSSKYALLLAAPEFQRR